MLNLSGKRYSVSRVNKIPNVATYHVSLRPFRIIASWTFPSRSNLVTVSSCTYVIERYYYYEGLLLYLVAQYIYTYVLILLNLLVVYNLKLSSVEICC
jgi:hypothetical protein